MRAGNKGHYAVLCVVAQCSAAPLGIGRGNWQGCETCNSWKTDFLPSGAAMSGAEVLLDLGGAVALLLWATYMVRTGVERAFGAVLRDHLGRALRNRVSGAAAGMLLAVMLQSSTAVVLIVTGFASAGYLAAVPAVAAAVGADFGSALIAGLLRMNLAVLTPILLLAGMIAHRASEARNWRQIGRILFGLGLLLLSLRMIGQASAPLRDGTGVPAMLAIVRGDAVILFLMAGMTAWLFHSSLAAILLAALFAAQGLIVADQAVPIVLGINFGGAIMALTLTRTAVGDGRIVPLANLLLRGTGAILALMASALWGVPAVLGGYDAGNAVMALHIGFNAAVLVVGLCVAGPLCAALHGVLAQRKANFGRVTALNTGDLGQPDVALRNASREALVLSGMIETMLATLPDLLRHGDADAFTALEVMDADVDRVYADIKTYLTQIAGADPRCAAEVARLMHVVVRLEQVGDVVAQRVAVRAQKKKARGLAFSEAGWAEILALHAELMASARLACNVIASEDITIAARLVEQKGVVREMERQSTAQHLQRLRDGRMESRESSAMHLDTLYDFKEINSLLVELAYPLLEGGGHLRSTRLKKATRSLVQ
jgi:phosphate:Na+ symporter